MCKIASKSAKGNSWWCSGQESGIAEELGDDVDLTNSDISAAIIAKAPQDVPPHGESVNKSEKLYRKTIV